MEVSTLNINRLVQILIIVTLLGALMFSCRSASTVSNDNSEIDNKVFIEIFDRYSPLLDGAYAESYCYELCEAYKKGNMRQFIKVLSEYDINTVKGIMNFLVGGLLASEGKTQIQELKSVFEELEKDKSLSPKEKFAVYQGQADIIFFTETLLLE